MFRWNVQGSENDFVSYFGRFQNKYVLFCFPMLSFTNFERTYHKMKRKVFLKIFKIEIFHLTLHFSCLLVFWLYYAFLLTSVLNSSGSLSVRLSLDLCVVFFWLYYAFLSISVLYSSGYTTPFSRSLCCILLVV